MRSVSEARGTHPQRVGNDVGVDVGNDVGVKPPPAKRGQGGTGRAAELASEAARAEGASLTRHRPWPATGGRPGSRSSAIEAGGQTRRLGGAAFGGPLIQQPTRPAAP